MNQETIDQILKFRDDRDWKQFHNPKDLAISISLEAAELLEVFQWSAEDVTCSDKIDKIKEELGWYPETPFEEGIVTTINWYLANREWVKNVVSGDYQDYYKKMYEGR